MKYRVTITQEFLKSNLDYDPLTGVFKWKYCSTKRKEWNTRFAGKIAGYKRPNGYIEILDHLAHRLAWVFMMGEWPKYHIDHIDGNETNNKFDNLRDATPSQNQCNHPIRKDNKLGIKGVYLSKIGKYVVSIQVNKKGYWLGTYDTIEEATEVRRLAVIKYHGDFGRI